MNYSNNAEKKLIKNTVIYMVGNLSSKILQILILPILTTFLLTEEYGTYDLIVNSVNLIIPIITLQIVQGMFRDLFNADECEKKIVVSSVISVLVVGCVFLGIGIFFLDKLNYIKYSFFIYLLVVSNIFVEFMQKLARCQKKNTSMAISGVILTISMLAIEVFTLCILKIKVEGLLIANIIASIIACIYLNTKLHVKNLISNKNINLNIIKKLLNYSIPLVVNSICWWLITTSDRYIIYYYLSTSAIGIYSIAGKFSQSLTMITGIFQMAWQESIIMESSKDSRNVFYTRVFDQYIRLLLCGYILVLPIIKISISFLLADRYREGYIYIPLLLLGAVMAACSQFYGSAYLAFKKTKGAISTTIVAALINILISISLIGKIGLYAPALGTAVAFLGQWILRIQQMQSYFQVKLDKKYLGLMSIIISVYYEAYYYESLKLDICMILVAIFIFILFNKEIINKFKEKISKKIER